jgi:HK97 family phage prohead protease
MVDLKEMREKAARARRESIDDTSPDGIRRARAAAPLDVGRSRSLTFPVVLRASMEQRANAAADEPPWVHLTGIASVTETPYEMFDMFGPYVETVASTAFNASLSRKPDVAFLVNHSGLTMARTTNGTLVLHSGDKGLDTEAWLNPTRADVGDLAIAINDGCIDQMSFAAMLNGGEWNDEYTEFRMTELDLHCGDVSAVNYGANPNTTIAARAHRFLNEMDRLPSGAAMAALRHLEVRFGKEPSGAAGNDESAQGRSINLVRSALLADDDE